MNGKTTLLIPAAAILCLLATVRPACADLVLIAPNLTAAAGSSGMFDVTLTNTGTSAVTVGGFSFDLSTSGPVTFTDVTDQTSLPYVFVGQSLFGPDILDPQSPSLPAAEVLASDTFSITAITLASGATVALGNVSYSIAANALSGTTYGLTFRSLGVGTSLADSAGEGIPADVQNGQVTVPDGGDVPVLGVMQLTLLGVLVAGGRISRRA